MRHKIHMIQAPLTIIHHADLRKAMQKNLQVIFDLVIEAGVHVDARNKEGKTAYDELQAAAETFRRYHPDQKFFSHAEDRLESLLKLPSLMCLTARVLRKSKSELYPYLPDQLIEFVMMH